MTEREIIEASAGERIALIAESYLRLTGRKLTPPASNVAGAMWEMPAVILAHGIEADPLFFYGNRAALDLFEMDARQFTGLPSRLSAEPLLREERSALLKRVTRRGFIDDYSGIRISSTGRRFRIEQATVWNLIDAEGNMHGQAATFSHWHDFGP